MMVHLPPGDYTDSPEQIDDYCEVVGLLFDVREGRTAVETLTDRQIILIMSYHMRIEKKLKCLQLCMFLVEGEYLNRKVSRELQASLEGRIPSPEEILDYENQPS